MASRDAASHVGPDPKVLILTHIPGPPAGVPACGSWMAGTNGCGRDGLDLRLGHGAFEGLHGQCFAQLGAGADRAYHESPERPPRAGGGTPQVVDYPRIVHPADGVRSSLFPYLNRIGISPIPPGQSSVGR